MKNMKRNLALLAIMLLLSLPSFAQHCLLGQVTDESGTSIQGAQLCPDFVNAPPKLKMVF